MKSSWNLRDMLPLPNRFFSLPPQFHPCLQSSPIGYPTILASFCCQSKGGLSEGGMQIHRLHNVCGTWNQVALTMTKWPWTGNCIISSALCYCSTAEIVLCKRLSVHKIIFLETTKGTNSKFTIFPDIFFWFWFLKLFFLFFLWFLFIFVNMRPYGRKNFKRNLLWKHTTNSLPKFHAYSWGRVFTKVIQRNVKS